MKAAQDALAAPLATRPSSGWENAGDRRYNRAGTRRRHWRERRGRTRLIPCRSAAGPSRCTTTAASRFTGRRRVHAPADLPVCSARRLMASIVLSDELEYDLKRPHHVLGFSALLGAKELGPAASVPHHAFPVALRGVVGRPAFSCCAAVSTAPGGPHGGCR